MLLAPTSDPVHFTGPAEAVTIAVFAEPSALGGGLAGVAASRLGTVMLPIGVARIGNEHLAATAAFASARRAAHREPHLVRELTGRKRKRRPARRRNRKKEEEIYEEVREENPAEENGISNRHFSTTFIPPLTAAKKFHLFLHLDLH
jgi:hypothetical protein